MTELALVDAYCDAHGHPAECTEPAPGYITAQTDTGITVTAGGVTKQVSSLAATNIFIPEHCHTYNDGCTDCYSHNGVDEPFTVAKNITVNGSPVRIIGEDVGRDPGTTNHVDANQNQEENASPSSGTTIDTKRTVSATETITS